jgi:hypothetical protein
MMNVEDLESHWTMRGKKKEVKLEQLNDKGME